MGRIKRFLIVTGVISAGATAYGALTAHAVYRDVMKNQHQVGPA